jgi:hypothetical protein
MKSTRLLHLALLAALLVAPAVLPGCYSTEPYYFSIVPGRLPDGFVGRPYYGVIELTYNYQPTTADFRVTSGVLPPGITLEPNGTLVGYPTAPGTFSFVVQVNACWGDPYYGGPYTDCQAASQSFSITVYP